MGDEKRLLSIHLIDWIDKRMRLNAKHTKCKSRATRVNNVVHMGETDKDVG